MTVTPAQRVAPSTPVMTVNALERWLRRWYAIGAAAIGGVAVIAALLTGWLTNATEWVAHTNDVLRVAYTARTLTADGASATDPRLRVALDSLHTLTADNPAQHQRARAIRDALDRGGADAVRPAFAAFLDAEQRLYGARARVQAGARWVFAAVVLAGLALLALVLRRFRWELGRQATVLREQQQQLEEQAVELEYQLEQLQQQATELETTLAATERAQDEAMRAREEWKAVGRRLTFVLESSPLAIAILDGTRHVELANPAFAALAGGPGETIGRLLAESMPAYAAVLDPLVAGVFDGGDAGIDVELTIPGAPGPRLWSASVYPIRADGSGVVGAGVVLLEITERRQLEEQFRHAQRLEAVGRLTGGIAHDFNNILTAITGFGELVATSLAPDTVAAEDMQQVLLAAERATALTRQLLAFSRQQVLQPELLDLNEVIAELEPLLRRLLGEDVALDVRLTPALGPVLADPGQIEQILMNLAVNARDAMPNGGRLAIDTRDVVLDAAHTRAHPGSTAGAHVAIAVTDDGIGMDDATRARAFEPFFTTKPAGKGTGLGLSTVYGIVRQSGGSVAIESAPGRGTTFRVYLPLHHGAAPRPTPSRAMPGVADRPATILLVEDDATVASVATRVLEDHGYRVLRAANGHAALATADAHPDAIDLVITDLVMPELGGRALADHLASVRPSAQILFMSGYTADAADQRAVLPADAAFLEKPFRPQELLGHVRRLLAAPAAPAAEAPNEEPLGASR